MEDRKILIDNFGIQYILRLEKTGIPSVYNVDISDEAFRRPKHSGQVRSAGEMVCLTEYVVGAPLSSDSVDAIEAYFRRAERTALDQHKTQVGQVS